MSVLLLVGRGVCLNPPPQIGLPRPTPFSVGLWRAKPKWSELARIAIPNHIDTS